MSIVFTGGGTGGHLTIIAAVKEHIDNRDLIYIGSVSGQDRAWFEEDDDFKQRYFLNTQTVVNRGVLGKIKSLSVILKEAFKIRKILKSVDAKVVFSVGGYSAAPASIAAKMLNIPLVIHEQNSHIGNLNRVFKPLSHRFIWAFDKEDSLRIYPVKEIFFNNYRVRGRVKSILISGGSQGSVALNNFALSIAKELDSKGIKIYHQAGEKNLEKVKDEYEKLGVDAEVFGFTKEMPEIMKKADFAIARAGASTLWEMTATGLPALYVPYPYAANDHQYYNAKFLAEQNLAWLKRENELEKELIFDIIDSDLTPISKRLPELIEPNGAKKIAKYLENFN